VRHRQSKVFAQRVALIRSAKQPARLEDRHDLRNKLVEGPGKVGRHDIEAVGCTLMEPGFQHVGHLRASADGDPSRICLSFVME